MTIGPEAVFGRFLAGQGLSRTSRAGGVKPNTLPTYLPIDVVLVATILQRRRFLVLLDADVGFVSGTSEVPRMLPDMCARFVHEVQLHRQ